LKRKKRQQKRNSVGKFYRINQYIQAREVRVVDEQGAQIGVLPIFNAIQKAKEQGKDLVEVAPNAQPPVAKIIDFKKFKYLEAKKEREEKKAKKGGDLKEVRFTPFMADGDINTRIKRIREFLGDGFKIKLKVWFSGRELTRKEFGYRLIERVLAEIGEAASKEGEPRFQGREIYLIIAPSKTGGKSKKETTKQLK
jgi:translation initiation factor IF-3